MKLFFPLVSRGAAVAVLVVPAAAVGLVMAACAHSSDNDAPPGDASVDALLPDGALPDGASPEGADASDADAPVTHPVHLTHACADVSVVVDVLEDAALRLHYVGAAGAQAERGWTFDLGAFAGPTSAKTTDANGVLSVDTPALHLAIDADCNIDVTAVDGSTVWKHASPFTRDASGKIAIARALEDGEHIYGLGEKTGISDRRGRAFDMWNSDPAWTDPQGQYRPVTDPIYQSHPYFLSLLANGHASGAYIANTRHLTFDVGKTKGDTLAFGADGGDVDLFVFDGPSPAAVLEKYTRLVGRAPRPPLWALGYHQSRWSYTPSQRVEDVAFQFRQRNLPADGMWLDIDYMDGFRDFTWNPNTFADAKGMLARLAANGFKVTTIFDPGVKNDPGNKYFAYDDGVSANVFLKNSDGSLVVRDCWPGAAVFPDFTKAATRAWWGARLGDFMSAGTRGAWIDMNEPAVFVKDGFPLESKVDGDGTPTTFAEIKNAYALLMAKATYEGQLKAFPNRRPFVLTRAGFAGIQKYAAVWTGDAQSTWDHLAMAPSMLAGLGVSGVPFVGSDIGGFTGGPSAELYGRWFELGSLSPFFRSHVATGMPDQEPWAFGPEVEDLAHRMLALRYSLLPYWYEAYVTASESGSPLVRPLWFEYPADAEAQKHDDEIFIGPSLLAAPVTAADVTSRPVYIPAGVYYDMYTGAAYTGPKTVTLPAPLGRIPILVRAGAMLHEQDVPSYVGATPNAPHYIDVYPGAAGTKSAATWLEDDGESLDYAKGGEARTSLSLDVTAQGLTLQSTASSGAFAPPAHPIVLRVHGVTAQPAASIDGAPAAVTWSSGTRTAIVTFPALTAAHAVTLTYDSVLAAPRNVDVAFNVALPANSPAGDIYVASSAGAWQPNGQILARNGVTASGTLTVLEGTLVKYKLTRGAWTSVEVDPSCAAIANRSVVASVGTNVNIGVAKWTDACP